MLSKILQILNTYTLNYPIIRNWGMSLPCPVAIVVSDWNIANQVIDAICSSPIIFNEATGVPAMKKNLQNFNSRGIFLKIRDTCNLTKKNREKIDIIAAISSDGIVDGMEVNAATFLVFFQHVPTYIRGGVFEVRISEVPKMEFEVGFSLVPKPEQLSVVRQKLEELEEVELTFFGIYAAAMFLYPRMHEMQADSEFDEIVNCANEIAEQDIEDEDQIVQLLCERFLSYADSGGFDQQFELPNLETEAIQNKDQAVFFRGKMIYFSDQKFVEIFDVLSGIFSLNEIKFYLKAAGILQAGSVGYSKKMSYVNAYGRDDRIRMFCVDADMIVGRNGDKLSFYFD